MDCHLTWRESRLIILIIKIFYIGAKGKLDIEHLEFEKIALHRETQDLGKVITEAIFLNQIYADKYKIKLVYQPSIETIFVRIDKNRMIQVITNLISNAVKFSFPNHPVTVSMCKHGRKVRVSVLNHGEGIPEDFRENVFKKFSQANFSLDKNKGGTGLGLAISRDIIECFGGHLDYTSELNNETAFYFDLPIVKKS